MNEMPQQEEEIVVSEAPLLSPAWHVARYRFLEVNETDEHQLLHETEDERRIRENIQRVMKRSQRYLKKPKKSVSDFISELRTCDVLRPEYRAAAELQLKKLYEQEEHSVGGSWLAAIPILEALLAGESISIDDCEAFLPQIRLRRTAACYDDEDLLLFFDEVIERLKTLKWIGPTDSIHDL